MTQAWSEQALLLGPRKSLVAVVTKPTAAPSPVSDQPMVVFLNSGIVHRVGANRMTVQLSRTLAAAGYATARFDLSGIGDSEPRPDALPPLDAALADIRDALDSLQATRKVDRFILVGLCSGANHNVIYSGTDDRVVGAVLLEPAIPPPLRHHVHHYGRHALRLNSWLKVMRGRNVMMQRLTKRIAAKVTRTATTDTSSSSTTSEIAETEIEAAAARQPHITDPEVRTFLENAYRRLIDRAVPFLVVLTGESWYYRESFLHAFPTLRFGKELQLEYFGDADHVFTSRSAAAEVTRLIVEWTQRTMAPGNRNGA